MRAADDTDLIGRQAETGLLRAALDDVVAGSGEGAAFLLRGEAGLGKTALLDLLHAEAGRRGCTVLRALGTETEEGVAFGLLHQVVGPLLRRPPAGLPRHHAEALESALGLGDAPPRGGLLIGAAALTLLAETGRAAPVVVLLDDVHRTDASSAAVFAFLHRRLAGLPTLIVSACRPGRTRTDGWAATVVDVSALGPRDAGDLVRRHRPRLPSAAVRRVVREAAGNPLALLELPVHRTGDPLDGTAPWPAAAEPAHRLDRLFAARLDALSPAAGRVLLLTALGGETAAWNAAAWLADEGADAAAEAVEQIEASGLAHRDLAGRLTFRHPLVRSAIIARATVEERRSAHRELSASLAHDDPRRLRHEAAAAVSADEDLAARLEAAGREMARRGGDAEGAVLLDRAAALGTDPRGRARRRAWAAVMAARGGRLRYTARLVEELAREPVPAEVLPLFAYAVVYVDQSHRVDFESSFTLLPRALGELAATGTEAFPGLAEQMYFKLVLATVYTDDPRGWSALDRHGPQVSPLARLCRRAWSDPARTAHGVADELRARVDAMGPEQEAGAAWLVLWTAAAVDAADARLWRRFSAQHGYATQGTIAKAKGYQDYLAGRWDQAESRLREAEAADELGYHCNALVFRHHYAHFLAGRGDEDGFREVERHLRPRARRARMTFVEDHLDHLTGLVALAHGRYEEAYRVLAGLTPPGVLPRGLPWFHLPFFDLVEAAVHTGRTAQAEAHVAAARATRMADISPHHAFLLAAATALAARGDDAEARFATAFAVDGAEQWVFPMARLRLAHGRWLRRHHRATARHALRTAAHAFRSLGATPWAVQAERELRAAGIATGAAAGAADLLTAQQARVARLAADGLTDKQIGAELRLSSRTVADHLAKVYRTLGITSRAALSGALDRPFTG
ncbi:LuxR family transcriptional regulator [Streptomyces sp. FBKL.4005]|uniref:ATP-binding protein n=1 Tax=Streptomyces sp. FBKL.4005 TaxID=2015515 RepID=UPI000B97711A|nr:LuxR family transcriptional regulator [Streptomyces sp. FBKL.4005]OYP19378.1 LuxR family transcriptional regulator [Streptomyces sp. FBKL.4005]